MLASLRRYEGTGYGQGEDRRADQAVSLLDAGDDPSWDGDVRVVIDCSASTSSAALIGD